MRRIPLSTRTVYEDLLDKKLSQELFLDPVAGDIPKGSFVTKQISGKTYWYYQSYMDGRKVQSYIGPDTSGITSRIEGLKRYKYFAKNTQMSTIVTSLSRFPGIPKISREEGEVLQSIEHAGVFRNGGILIGTHAFRCYSFLFGILLDSSAIRTADIAIAFDRSIKVFVPKDSDRIYEKIRATLDLVPIPSLDRKNRSYAFQIGNSGINLEILTTFLNKEDPAGLKPVEDIGFYAQPLEYMDYLTQDPVKAVILFKEGILVNVPDPERYACHKILVSQLRRADNKAKREKDLMQAGLILTAVASTGTQGIERNFLDLFSRLTTEKDKAALDAGLATLNTNMASSLRNLMTKAKPE